MLLSQGGEQTIAPSAPTRRSTAAKFDGNRAPRRRDIVGGTTRLMASSYTISRGAMVGRGLALRY
jgi:hypothetical protein